MKIINKTDEFRNASAGNNSGKPNRKKDEEVLSKRVEWFKPWYLLPKTATNYKYVYDFKLFNRDSIPSIFLGTAILAPFIISIILRLIFGKIDPASYVMAINVVVGWVVVGIGWYLIGQKMKNEMVASGTVAFYIFYYVPSIVSLIASFILAALFGKSSNFPQVAQLIVSLISDLVCVALCLFLCPIFKFKILSTLKNDYKIYLIVFLGFVAVTFAINLAFSAIQAQVNSAGSSNQNSLVNGVNIWYNALILGILTIFLAPIIEEMATRHSIFLMSGKPWIGFVASVIYFAGMHVWGAGDWEDIIGYLGASIALAGVFFVARYNLTYTIMTHAALNLITFILILAGKSKVF